LAQAGRPRAGIRPNGQDLNRNPSPFSFRFKFMFKLHKFIYLFIVLQKS
jgi:hypothetical protein